MTLHIEKIDANRWLIPKSGGMRTDGLIFADEKMIQKVVSEKAAEQVANVATLPGIVGSSMAMPDIHWGYGFPIGGVAAFNMVDGIISPGGVGYDISCSMRLLRTNLRYEDVKKDVPRLLDAVFAAVPSGVGSEGKLRLSRDEMKQVFKKGARWAVEKGFGERADLEVSENRGCMEDADPDLPSARAVERGMPQMGTLGSGNHFIEFQVVDEIFHPAAAATFGLGKGQLVVMVHTGSRGCGYQVCDDSIKLMDAAARKYGYNLPDRQLCCAPFNSPEGQRYYRAMCAAANYARANHQVITHLIREAFMRTLNTNPRDLAMDLVYEISHNIGKIEEHVIPVPIGECAKKSGKEPVGQTVSAGKTATSLKKQKFIVHRKGATRAFPAGHPDVPEKYRDVGQPVIIPGTMGTESYVLVGTEQAMRETFGSVCHGAGRVMSRTQALKQARGQEVARQLEQHGILVRTDSYKGLAEEAPFAYKDVGNVVDICEAAGLSRKVARLKPVAVVKG